MDATTRSSSHFDLIHLIGKWNGKMNLHLYSANVNIASYIYQPQQ